MRAILPGIRITLGLLAGPLALFTQVGVMAEPRPLRPQAPGPHDHRRGGVRVREGPHPPGKDRILGATIVGRRAGELISEFSLAMKNKFGLDRILRTIHPYPTLAEANKAVAGDRKEANVSHRTLGLLRRYHAWRLG